MKKHCSFLSFLSCFLLLFTACRRDWDTTPLPAPTTLSFFDLPVGSFPIVQQLAQSLQQQELRQPFARELMLKVGWPAWNRTLVLGGTTGARGNSDTTMVFIPLLPADSSRITGVLACALMGSDTLYKIIYAGDYAQYGFTANGTAPDAQAIALLLMQLEYQVLGPRHFALLDVRLFVGSEAAQGRLLALQPAGEGCANCALASGPVHAPCFNYDVWNGSGGANGSGTYTYGAEGCYNFIPTPGGSGNWNAGWTTNVPQTGSGPGWSNIGWAAAPMAGYQNLLTSDVSAADQQLINGWKLLNVDMSGLDSCRKIMLTKLLSGNNDLGRLLVKLDKALGLENNIKDFKIKYISTNSVPPDLAAITSCAFVGNVFEAVININPTAIQRATDIALAHTLIHETLHAYMDFILYRIINGMTAQQLNQYEYSQVFGNYVDTLVLRNQAQLIQFHDCSANSTNQACQYQHNYMANALLDWMAKALQQFDNNNINDYEYYWKLSWKGLQRTNQWVSFWPNYNSFPSPGWSTITNPASSDSDKKGFTFALTTDRLIDIHNSIFSEQLADQDAKGKKPHPITCYQ